MTELLISAFIKNKDDLKNHKVRQAYGTMGGAVGIFAGWFPNGRASGGQKSPVRTWKNRIYFRTSGFSGYTVNGI